MRKMRWASLGYRQLGTCLTFRNHLSLVSATVKHSKKLTLCVLFHSSSFQNEFQFLGSSVNLTDKTALQILHGKVIKAGSSQIPLAGDRLLNLYVKLSNLGDAQKLFDEITERDVRAWTILISGAAKMGLCRVALESFVKMQMEGIYPNKFTLSSFLKCCISLNELQMGKGIHGWILRKAIALDAALENSILDFYVKCGTFHYVERFFDLMTEKDTVSWNIMIGAYLQNGLVEKSVDVFRNLRSKDVASWNTIIAGQMQRGFKRSAMDLLYQMAATGPSFDNRTFSIALVLVSSLSILNLGVQIHSRLLRLGINDDWFMRDSLIDMYCKCGQMDKASLIFDKLTHFMVKMKDSRISSNNSVVETVSCSSMVSGYVRIGRWEEALNIFRDMIREQVSVDPFTLTSVITACTNSGILELGQQIHCHVQKIGHELDVFLGSALIDMYTKCGSFDSAQLLFRIADDRNVVLWTTVISGCALHGLGKEAISYFELMIRQGICPNEISFVGVLTACSHAGLIEEGSKYFALMEDVYGIKPGIEHYTCMIDLFGRAGRFSEAKAFIYENDISHISAVWAALLSSCCVHKNIETGKWVAHKLLQLEPSKGETYILLSNMCAANQRWNEAADIRVLMKKRGTSKLPGQSWVQLKSRLYTFVMGDRSHPQAAEIYAYLDKLTGRVKEIGYSADLKQVSQDVEEEQKEELLAVHSEKLAVAYAIMSTTSKAPIRVMKNLRICTDCHQYIKFTSQLLGRDIIVRDIHRFHHFKKGSCSCGDYW